MIIRGNDMIDPKIKWCSRCNLYRTQDWLVCPECHKGGCACFIESECPHVAYMDEEDEPTEEDFASQAPSHGANRDI